MPISVKVNNENELVVKRLPKQFYVKTIHQGPYQKVGATYKKMYFGAMSKNIDLLDESIEIYLNDPKETKKNYCKPWC